SIGVVAVRDPNCKWPVRALPLSAWTLNLSLLSILFSLIRWIINSQVVIGCWRDHPSTGSSTNVANLNQVGFVHFFNRIGFFTNIGSNCFQTDRPALVEINHRQQHFPVDFIKAAAIYLEE